jgi:putative PIN family toxin of toxin-antitoxin system
MRPVIFDTNVLLDLFVFNDFRAIHLKQALLDKKIDALASPITLEEFSDVISRPLFALDVDTQKTIFQQWQSYARIIEDHSLVKAPWECRDHDDQIFLDLAFTAKPSVLISKDSEILKLANRAAPMGILITANYSLIAQDL